MYDKNYELLADAIIVQAAKDYSNLIILHRNVHILIHATKTETIRAYLDLVAPDTKTLDKINKLRIMAGNSKIDLK